MSKQSKPTPDHVIIRLDNGIEVRPLADSDAPAISRHANDRRVWDNLRNRMPHPYTEADAREWVERNRSSSMKARSGAWTEAAGSQGPEVPLNYCIVLDGEAIGSIGLEFGTDIYFRTAEVGYWLGHAYWGRGIMGKVVPAFVQWAWDTFDILVRINAEAREDNYGSRRMLEKAGLKLEGHAKNAFWKNGKLQNNVYYGMLRPGTE